MNADNQSYVIIFLGIALLLSIYCNMSDAIVTGLTGALAGLFMGKTLNEHQSEIIDDQLITMIRDVIQEQLLVETGSGEDGNTNTTHSN